MSKKLFVKLVGAGFGLLATCSFASDVGMITDSGSGSDVGMIGATDKGTAVNRLNQAGEVGLSGADAAAQGNFFVHVDGGYLFRDVQSNSGLFCLDTTTSSFGTTCATEQSWKRGKRTAIYSAGLGFRYNAAFALDFAYWGARKQSTTALSGTSNLSLHSWLVTALYQAQMRLFSKIFLMPQVGLAYMSNRVRGINNGVGLTAKTANWRPAVGLGILAELCQYFALNLSGLYVPSAGHSPTLGLTYPSMQMVTLGLRFTF